MHHKVLLLLISVTLLIGCNLEVIPPVEITNTDPPIADFDFMIADNSCMANCAINFTNTSENATTYEWSFGDGSTLNTEESPSHTYSAIGIYTVSLKAINSNGTNSFSQTINLNTTVPVANFEFDDADCEAPCNMTFSNTSLNATQFSWDFGDPASGASNTSNLQEPSHLYAVGGTYEVTLSVDGPGGSDEIIKSIEIKNEESFQFIRHFTEASNTINNFSIIDNALTNDNPNVMIMLSSVQGSANTDAVGVFYFGGRWRVFNEGLEAMPADVQFNILLKDVTDPKTILHVSEAATFKNPYSTEIDHPLTNDNPNARLFVTMVWEKFSDYNNHPIGVEYENGKWSILNLDEANLPMNATFNVYVNDHDNFSFTHTSSSASIFSNYTQVNNALSNEMPDGNILVTAVKQAGIGSTNSKVLGLRYFPVSQQWAIVNQDVTAMPEGVSFNMLIAE